MNQCSSSSKFVYRALTLAVVLGAGVAVSGAQVASQPGSQNVAGTSAASVKAEALPAQAPAVEMTDEAMSSSSSAQSAGMDQVASLHPMVNFAEAMQYGGGERRRRYGSPRYRGGNTNADGSPKYTFFAGAGLAQTIGNTWHYDTPNFGLQVGGGRNFNKKFGVMAQFDYDKMGLTGQTLTNQINLYNNDINYYCSLNAANAAYCAANGLTDYTSLDGNAHVWSFTLNPTYTFFQGESVGAYAVAGAGFYHKVTNFTTPTTGIGYSPYYGYYQYTANEVIDHYTSNAPGFSGGFGLTYKYSRFANQRFYAEVRYVFVDNSHRAGVTVSSPVATTYTLANDFPANSNRTTYIPIKVGLRF